MLGAGHAGEHGKGGGTVRVIGIGGDGYQERYGEGGSGPAVVGAQAAQHIGRAAGGVLAGVQQVNCCPGVVAVREVPPRDGVEKQPALGAGLDGSDHRPHIPPQRTRPDPLRPPAPGTSRTSDRPANPSHHTSTIESPETRSCIPSRQSRRANNWAATGPLVSTLPLASGHENDRRVRPPAPAELDRAIHDPAWAQGIRDRGYGPPRFLSPERAASRSTT